MKITNKIIQKYECALKVIFDVEMTQLKTKNKLSRIK